MKTWYAVMLDASDNDWGYGSYNKRNAAKMVREARRKGNPDAYIAVIEESEVDAVCVAEIRDIKYI